jgi:hypothetical protein
MLKLISAGVFALALLSCVRPIRGDDAMLAPPPQSAPAASNADCSAQAPPSGRTRVYIAVRDGKDGSGTSLGNARDGSTPAAFDAILRCYSEGCNDPNNPRKSVAKTENLTVCLGPGTFSTLGNYDYAIGVPHGNPAGFTIGKGWKIHGAGADKTTVKLADYVPNVEGKNPFNFPLNTGTGLVFATNADSASNIEISDLTIDGNYPDLKSKARQNGITALTVEAIHLRSDQGGHWIHDVNVINTAGEIGDIDIRWEAFPVWIVSINNPSPTTNKGNVIESVRMSQSFGGTGCAIAIANAMAEVRFTLVNGYPIGYGGWKMGGVYFHDNTAQDTGYGFNVDSWNNDGVRIEKNYIIHPRKFGIVVGGEWAFSNFKIVNNVIRIDKPGVTGVVLRGGVSGAVISDNKVLAENSSAAKSTAVRSYSASAKAGANQNNMYQSNQIASGMKVVFESGSQKAQNCFYANRDDKGHTRGDLADNRAAPCPASPPASSQAK